MTTIIYVDGESHYIRSEHVWRKIHGPEAKIEWARVHSPLVSPGFPGFDSPYLRCYPGAKFFWDTSLHRIHASTSALNPTKGIYFTCYNGDSDRLHAARRCIRDYGFEPDIVKEASKLAKQRLAILGSDRIIEKPKGVDIRLAVRLLEDAYRDLFSSCMLLTSDVDFIPVIDAVQRMGKRVYVFGFREGVASQSDFDYVPEKFIDLGDRMSQYLCDFPNS